MAERKESENPGSPPARDTSAALPHVDAPPLSPATDKPDVEPNGLPDMTVEADPAAAVTKSAPSDETQNASPDADTVSKRWRMALPKFSPPRIHLSRRTRRSATLAASVTVGAAIGAVIGAMVFGSFFASKPAINAVAQEERETLYASLAQLSGEIATLKAGIETANESTKSEIAKLPEQVEPTEPDVAAAAPLITGSTPPPRPAAEIQATPGASDKPNVVHGWVIRAVRNGRVLVQGHGDIYDVVPGAPLPGLGRIETIKRLDGRWVVVTPKGIITARRDRAYFERL